MDSLTKALHAAGMLVVSPDGKHLKVQRRMNGSKPYGCLLSPEVETRLVAPILLQEKESKMWTDPSEFVCRRIKMNKSSKLNEAEGRPGGGIETNFDNWRFINV